MQASRTRSYVKGLATGYVVTLATIGVKLWLTPFVLRYLDREQFAVFTLAGDMLMWLGLMEIGFAAVLNVQAAQLSGRPDQRRLDTLTSTTFFAQAAIAAGILAVGGLVALYFSDFFALRPDLRHDASILMALMVLGAAIRVSAQTFSSLLIAHQQIHVDNLLRLLLLGLRTVITVVLLTSGLGLLSLGFASLFATAVASALAWYRVRRLLPGLRIRWQNLSWSVLRETGGLGIWFSLGGLAGIMIFHLDRIVTAKVVSVEMVTTLTLTGAVYLLTWNALQQITNTARPALAQIIGEGRMDDAREKYHQLVSLSTGLAIIAAGSLWAGNGAFVHWWVDPQNYGGAWLDALLAVNLVVHAWVLPNRSILTAGLTYVPKSSGSRFVEGLANLAFSIVLGWRWGMAGVVAATAIAGILTSCWYLPWLTTKQFGVHLGVLLKRDLPALVGTLAVMLMAAVLGRNIAEAFGGIGGALFGGGAALVLGMVVFVAFFLDRAVRNIVLARLTHLPPLRQHRISGAED
jgi:O-antigen/teichoic acid export membrane protein